MDEISIEDRTALQDAMTAYCLAADSLSDMDALLDIFTEDAVLDMGAMGTTLNGHDEMRAFYTGVFDTMAHNAHILTNFRVNRFDGDSASAQAYVVAIGRTKTGDEMTLYVRHFKDFIRTDSGWKCYKFASAPLLPLPVRLTENAEE